MKILKEKFLKEEELSDIQIDEVDPSEYEASLDDEINEPLAETKVWKVSFKLGSHENWSRFESETKEEAEREVTKYITNKWPDRDFEVTEVEEFNEDEEIKESLNEDMHGTFSDKFFDYLHFLLDNGKEEDIPYLTTQLIRYCKEDDLKDLWFDRIKSVSFNNGFGKEDGSINEDYVELEDTTIIDDLGYSGAVEIKGNRIYADRATLKQIRKELADNDINVEIINESITDAKPIEEGPKVGMAGVINSLIVDEYEAIEGYNSAIVTAQLEGFEDAANVLTEIQAEENIHVGQLLEVMKLFDPNANKVEDGQAEGAEQLANPITTDIVSY